MESGKPGEMKQNKTLIKELRAELHHWQMIARIDARVLKGTRNKCKQIGAKMRELQKGIKAQ